MSSIGAKCRIVGTDDIRIIELGLHPVVQSFLKELRAKIPVNYYDQRKCPYPDYTNTPAWFQPSPSRSQADEYRIWLDVQRLGGDLADTIAHEVGHALIHHKGVRGLKYVDNQPNAQDIANRVGDILEDPWVERILREQGVDRTRHDELMVHGFVLNLKALRSSFAYEPRRMEAHLCHRYVVTKLELGTGRFQSDRFSGLGFEQIWAALAQSDVTRARASEIHDYLEKNPPTDRLTYKAAATQVISILELDSTVLVPSN
ncbi:MAG: hypothetical protein Q8P22_06395 [Chloroflexota bacterium]|nr:hypothetical protein [Chloroflexota bacterium]